MTIHRLVPTIDVETPIGSGTAIAWVEYGDSVNTCWKVRMGATGQPVNFWDDDIRICANLMNGEKIDIPKGWKK
jgi:hypothetical protein